MNMIPVAERLDFQDVAYSMPSGYFCDECRKKIRAGDDAASLAEDYTLCRNCFKPGWYGRLSAPGYVDASDWNGPFETAAEALHYTCERYEVEGCDCDACEVARDEN